MLDAQLFFGGLAGILLTCLAFAGAVVVVGHIHEKRGPTALDANESIEKARQMVREKRFREALLRHPTSGDKKP